MRKISALTILVTLCGCASSYTDTKSTAPFVYKSSLENTLAAKCIVDNANNRGAGGFFAFPVEKGVSPNTLEVKVNSPHTGFAAIFKIEQVSGGSLITGWISDHYVSVKQRSMDIYIKGC